MVIEAKNTCSWGEVEQKGETVTMKKLLCLALAAMLLFGVTAVAEETGITIACKTHEAYAACKACDWDGLSTHQVTLYCHQCDGKGAKICMDCFGYGTYLGKKCTTCYGQGSRLCYGCYGSGVSNTFTEKRKSCPSCGTHVVCYYCRGMDGKTFAVRSEETPLFAYRDVMRAPDEKVGATFVVQGVIQSIEESGEALRHIVLQQEDNGIAYEMKLWYFVQPDDVKLLKGDTISFCGEMISYDDEDVPTFSAADVKLEK